MGEEERTSGEAAAVHRLQKLSCIEGKVVFIVNPISGLGKQKKIKQLVRKNLDQKLFEYEILYTKRPHHATELSREAVKRGATIVVAVGGDGSVNEVAQGMIGSQAALAIVPTGSGNGFALSFNIPKDPAKAIQVINEMSDQWVDTVKINDKSYLGVAGVGFDADVSRTFSNSGKRGPASYLLAVLSELPNYKPQNYDLVVDGIPLHKKAFLICFANSNQYGNNAFIAPSAKVDDGFLDVIIWKEFPPHAAPKLVHDLFTKHLDDSKYTETFRCQEVILKKPHQTLHIDGEPCDFEGDVYIRVLPSSLKVITPRG
ncbi:diacylglycerol/lipid kinase family protein [Candidatus Neptunochlamydia vexilliferae]|nr:diacylglycerol kinase family protein [Candidatus Neptunochlamydia vexilliferae]